MRQTNANSIAVYHTIVKPSLTKMQELVLSAYRDGLDHTDHEIADILHIGINRVSGRVGELLEKKQISEVCYRESKWSHIPSRACKIVPAIPETLMMNL